MDARGVVGYCTSLASLAVTAILEDCAVDVDLEGSGVFAEKW
jgi:hypothetical protein